MKLAILLLFPSLAFAQIIGAEDQNGDIVPVWSIPYTRCPLTDAGDAACMVYSIVGHRNDPETIRHELDHVAGLRHGPWVQWGAGTCARITRSGRTKWTDGKLLCRRDSGDYFEVEQ